MKELRDFDALTLQMAHRMMAEMFMELPYPTDSKGFAAGLWSEARIQALGVLLMRVLRGMEACACRTK